MSMTMADVLSLKPFRDALLIAGSSGLDRRVEHVTVIEVPESSRWGRRGTLAMSTLYSYPGRDSQRDLIARLAHGASGLAVHPGGPVEPCYDDIAEVAEQSGFPVLRLHPGVSYLQIFSAVYGELLNRQAAVLRSSEAIHSRFTHLVVQGQDMHSMAMTLYEMIGNPVLVLCAESSQRLTWGGPYDLAEGLARMMCGPQARSLMSQAAADSLQVLTSELLWPEPAGDERQVKVHIVPIRPGGDLARFLIVAEIGRPVDEIGMTAIRHASTAISFDVLRERAIIETERRLAVSLLDELLSGDPLSLESLVLRGNALGMDLRGRRIVFFVALLGTPGKPGDAADESHLDLVKASDGLLRSTEAVIFSLDPAAIIGARADGVVVLPSFQPGETVRSLRRRVRGIAARLAEKLARRLGDARFHVGVGAMVDGPAQLRWSYDTARWAVTAASMTERPAGVVEYDSLGFYQLAAGANARNPLDRFVSQALSELQGKTKTDQSELMRTLETFLDCRESFVATAERLHVHPNTVKYRMEKVRHALPQECLADPDQRLTLHLALKLRRLRL